MYNDDARANFKEAYRAVRRLLEIYYPRLLRSTRVIKRCFCPRRSVLRPFRRGAPRQRPANPMENRRRERKRKRGREGEGEKKHRQKSHFLSKYTPQEIPLSSNDTLSICRDDILRKLTTPLLLALFSISPFRISCVSLIIAFTCSFDVSVNKERCSNIFHCCKRLHLRNENNFSKEAREEF